MPSLPPTAAANSTRLLELLLVGLRIPLHLSHLGSQGLRLNSPRLRRRQLVASGSCSLLCSRQRLAQLGSGRLLLLQLLPRLLGLLRSGGSQ